MDFYEAQEKAHKKTRLLGFFFILSVMMVMLAVGALTVLLFSQASTRLSPSGGAPFDWANLPWEVFLTGAGAAGLTVLVPYGYKSVQLAGGGDIVAKDLGGRLLDGSPSDFHDQRLLNVVEEMALASGVPVPMVYVMDHENGINAFAAGTEPANAVVGVTRGCLERLTREELQGVIAHEFSHILNGDMKMNMKMVGWVFGLTAISIIGQMLFRSLSYGRVRIGGGSRDRDSGQAAMVIIGLGIGLMIIGGIGVFFARMLQSAISRQREYLADASAVQFTRNPDTIAGALIKIGGFRDGSKIVAPKATEASHLFFASGGLFSFGFATHPALEDRIKRIKQDWDGAYTKPRLESIHKKRDERTSGFASEQPQRGASIPIPPIPIGAGKGTIQLSPVLSAAAHDTTQAQLLTFAMLVASGGGSEGMESRHLQQISSDREGLQQIDEWSKALRTTSSLEKVALLDLAIPTLRRLSDSSKERFITITQELTYADREISLFEYMLQQVIERHLLRHARAASYSKVRYRRLRDIQPQADFLSSLMARCENNDVQLRNEDVTTLNQALDTCQHASLKVKNQLIQTMHTQAHADHVFTDNEAELLRAITDAIGGAIPLGSLR